MISELKALYALNRHPLAPDVISPQNPPAVNRYAPQYILVGKLMMTTLFLAPIIYFIGFYTLCAPLVIFIFGVITYFPHKPEKHVNFSIDVTQDDHEDTDLIDDSSYIVKFYDAYTEPENNCK